MLQLQLLGLLAQLLAQFLVTLINMPLYSALIFFH